MKRMSLVAAIVLASGLSAISATAQSVATAAPQQEKKNVTITGCVVKGDGGYVLSDVSSENAAAAVAAGTPSTPQPAGTVMPGRVFYWLKDDADLAAHAGHKVEVTGELEGDIEKGNISAEREGGLVELEFKIEGDKKVTVKVPDVPPSVGTAGSVGDKERNIPFVVRKIAVDSVKMISAACK
ncbi:MAG: hypothetical protein WBC51_24160 [Vicinamibacterales bacterium]